MGSQGAPQSPAGQGSAACMLPLAFSLVPLLSEWGLRLLMAIAALVSPAWVGGCALTVRRGHQ